MEMEFYKVSTQILITTLALVAIGLHWRISYNLPDLPIFKSYMRSRKLMGTIIFLYFCMNVSLKFFQLRVINPPLATSLNFVCYYAGALLSFYVFVSLLKPSIICKKKIWLDVIKYLCFVSCVLLIALFGTPFWQNFGLYIFAIFFFLDTVRMSVIFHRAYLQAVKDINNFYSDYVDGYIAWLYKGVLLVIITGVLGWLISFLGPTVIGIYSLFGAGVSFYLFLCFNNYLLHIKTINKVVDIAEEEKELEDNESKKDIESSTVATNSADLEKKIQEWQQNNGYLQVGITIAELSILLHTNRTYLSNYINVTYQCSFRDFINQQRIEYSKQLLLNTPTPITDIAEQIGFSSSSSFCRIFALQEGVSPNKWREQNNKDKEDI